MVSSFEHEESISISSIYFRLLFIIVFSTFHHRAWFRYLGFSPSIFRLFIIVFSTFHHRGFVILTFHHRIFDLPLFRDMWVSA
jgi:hypothetical protein